jgi:hypothetical protein
MRRLLILLLVLLPIVGHILFPNAVRHVIRAIIPSLAPFLFAVVLFVIALLTWLMRTLVESDPDPFFLNLTFFAFAGLCIRGFEFVLGGHKGNGFLDLSWLVGVFVVLLHIVVLKAHMRTTMRHYQKLLTKHRKISCSDPDIEHWANVLLQITGTDFAPGSYRWLEWLLNVFPSEPRERSRRDAFFTLPDTHFRKEPLDTPGLTVDSMAVPPDKRTMLWHWYWITCAASWLIFVVVIWMSQERKS